jgi:integrase
MLYREFAKIPFLAAKALDVKFKGRRFTACMIRHSCATYFVYEALKQKGRLGQHFVYDAALDEELRKLMGHKDIKTTLEYYVHLVNRFVHDDLLVDLKRAQVDSCLSALLEHHDYGGS